MTHPFHPLCGREFVFVAVRQTWGENRAFFLDDDAVLKSLPTAWTDAAALDPFVAMAAGRCAFLAEDLVVLAVMISEAQRSGDRPDL